MATFDGWDPTQYNRFASQREEPFWDLARLVRVEHTPVVIDLGCGDGRLTALPGESLGAARTLGVDSSPAMIEGARSYASESLRLELGDIGLSEERESSDVVFSNASMQWVPDHPAVMGRWAHALRPGGQLAIKVPSNADHPAHALADVLARNVLARNVLAPVPLGAHVAARSPVELDHRESADVLVLRGAPAPLTPQPVGYSEPA
jgi:trans-aconitate 2-methyltransferase